MQQQPLAGKEALKAMIDGEVIQEIGNQCQYRINNCNQIIEIKSRLSSTWEETSFTINFFLTDGRFSICKEPEHVFEPFEQVLVRDADDLAWAPSHYGWEDKKHSYQYHCSFSAFKQCIPYKGNEHLLGTTNAHA